MGALHSVLLQLLRLSRWVLVNSNSYAARMIQSSFYRCSSLGTGVRGGPNQPLVFVGKKPIVLGGPFDKTAENRPRVTAHVARYKPLPVLMRCPKHLTPKLCSISPTTVTFPYKLLNTFEFDVLNYNKSIIYYWQQS